MSKTKKLRRARQALQRQTELANSLEAQNVRLNLGMDKLNSCVTYAQITIDNILQTIIDVLPTEDMVSYLAGRQRHIVVRDPFDSTRVPIPHPTREVLTVEDVYPLLIRYSEYVDKYPHVLVKLEYDNKVSCYGYNKNAFAKVPDEILARNIAKELVKHMRRGEH